MEARDAKSTTVSGVFVLVVDTSSAAVTAALARVDMSSGEAVLIAEQVTVDARAHGELLAPSIAHCLDLAGIGVADLAAVVCGVGPGPFTGLRVGVVTAMTLSMLLGIPAYGVCSLDALALAISASGNADVDDVLVATDARRKEIYWARYVRGERVDGPQVAKPAVVVEAIGTSVQAMVGAGARLYADQLGLPLLDGDYPAPMGLLRAALPRVLDAGPSETLVPLYLRRPDAVEPNRPAKPVTP